MSKCVVHMQKMKMSALGGIQSHNQREHESKKNKEIDYEKSRLNFDTVNEESINYQRAVKERIAELNLKKAVRSDAVVYCSFIVSSDREFFQRLGEEIYDEARFCEKQSHWWDSGYTDTFDDFKDTDEMYQAECIRRGAETFFEFATEFFQERYGEENVINGTVHFDEYTPHMHLGVVPVTSDGRLSAKSIFTPLELKQLQTDFAEYVGEAYGLERGKEGSQAKHLDELSFKIQKRSEQLENLSQRVGELETRERVLTSNCKDLEKHAESLSKTVSDLKTDISTLDTQKRLLERLTARLEEYKAELKRAIEKIREKASSSGFNLLTIDKEIQRDRAMDFIEQTGQAEKFKDFCENPKNRSLSSFIAKGQTEQSHKRNTEHER